jgi:hypothetical protein
MSREAILTINVFGTKKWINKQGELHRLNGPAIEYSSGSEEWYENGLRHRIDGPAIHLSNGYGAWFIENKRHREDGPAVIFGDGDKEWWLNDFFYKTKEDYFDALTDEAKSKCLFSEDFLNE